MKRAMATFKKVGLNVEEHPADFNAVNSHITWDNYVVPKIDVMGEWKYLLKEMIGYYVYKLTGKA